MVSIDTVTMDTSRRVGIDANAGSLVFAYTVVLNGDVRWLDDTDTAALVAMDIIVPN